MGNLEREDGLGSGRTWDYLFPHPSQKAQCIISFHVRTLGVGGIGMEGQKIRAQKTSKIQKETSKLNI